MNVGREALMTAVIGTYILVIGFQGWMLTRLNLVERAVLVAGAIFIPFPVMLSNLQSILVGLALIAVFYLFQRNRREKILMAQPG